MLSWQKRCGLVEKTRRLGYYFPGWYDKLYTNVTGIEYGHKKKKNYVSKTDDALVLRRSNTKISTAGSSRPCTHVSHRTSRALKSAVGPRIIRRSYTQSPLRLDNQQSSPSTMSPQQSMTWNSSSNVGLTNGHATVSTPPPPIPPLEQQAIKENGVNTPPIVNGENSAPEDERTSIVSAWT